jgi:uncharacterized protein (TIGR02757 family)
MTKYPKSLFKTQPCKLREFLEKKYRQFNTLQFIDNDPIQIPHRYTKKQDIEISAFWTCILAWGNRKSIVQSAHKLMEWMHDAPHDFVIHHTEKDLKPFLQFKHRTFNATDTLYFIEFFKQHYRKYSSLEDAFFVLPAQSNPAAGNMENRLINFYHYFFSLPTVPERTRKHIATPARKSTCKRLNMFLRWMVRSDSQKVDFGIWKKIKPSELLCPLDVHVENTARYLGLIQRKQRDWHTVLELTENLKCFDPNDPVKYDFALFGISADLSNKFGILAHEIPD